VEISGRNGSGKTSALEAIKTALRGGTDATLLRKGEEKGEAVIVLDDGMQITRTVTAAASSTVVVGADGRKVARPAETVKALTDMMSVNPVDFLRATKKERVNVLLESLPIEIDLERIGLNPDKPGGFDLRQHPLVLIEAVRKHIFDDRTGLNRAVKEKNATISQLAATLPEQDGDTPATPQGLLDKLSELDRAKDAELARVSTKLEGIRAEHQTMIDGIKSDAQARIDAIRAEAQEAVAAKQAALANIEQLAAAQRERTITEHTTNTAEIRQQLATIEAAQKQAAKHEQTRETLEKMRAESKTLQDEADGQTAALESIDAYKSELLASLPIPGLTVVDGEIYQDGVPFDRINTAGQVKIAVEIAKLRAGEIGVACVDGLELLDSAAYAEFCDQAVASGLQLFVTRVSDGDFEVNTLA
jgi:DNA repair exonuclease SbcCD ATPase subunit